MEKFSGSGAFESVIGSSGSGDGQFSSPYDVQFAPNGNIYVLDRGNSRVQELTPAGSFVTKWGSSGSANGQFNSPQKLAVATNGNVYVSDNGNSRIQAFDGSGTFQTAWTAGSSPIGVAANAVGAVYVGDITANTVTKHDASGNLLTSFGGPGSGMGQFNAPFGIAAALTGEVYVADSGNNRLERWFDPDAWVLGTNSFASAGVGPGQLLGASQTLAAGKVLNVTGTTTINSGGTLTVSGGSLTAQSLVLGGAGAKLQVDTGAVNVSTFSVASGGTYHVGLGGSTIGSQYGSVAVSGAAALAGTLQVDLINGFQPSLGEQFTALTFGSESGDFASYNGLAVGGHLTLHHAFVGNSLILTARPTVDGDVNTDGVVNGLDIAAVSSNWLHHGITGDANGDGVVNGLDIALISANWLKTGPSGGGGSGTVAPEPSMLILAALGGLALLVYRRRR